MDVYRSWKDDPHLPIECLVNVVLLLLEERDLVQLDTTYYDDPATRDAVARLVDALDAVVRTDASGNYVVYLHKHAARIEAALCAHDGTVAGGFQTTRFARMLDDFYVGHGDLPCVLAQPQPVRVSIDVLTAAPHPRAGPLLVQMCHPATVEASVCRMYRRFAHVSRAVARVDPTLQTALTLYTKPGAWQASPELVCRHPTVLA